MTSNKKIFCIYHSVDFDGKCSGAIVKYKFPDAELIPYNYGDELDIEQFFDSKVFMVDCSLQPFDRMHRLASICDLTWIDHHKTAIEEHHINPLDSLKTKWRLNIEKAACELTWDYCFLDKKMPMPRAVWLLGRYDVWDLNVDPDVLAMQFGMRQHEGKPKSQEFWGKLFFDDYSCEAIINKGRIVLEYVEQWNKEICKFAFEAEIYGMKCICANVPRMNSQFFDSVWDPDRHEAMLAYYYTGKGFWTVSLYTHHDDINVGAVAKAHGGGGHKQAAGFQIYGNLPPDLLG
jgi:oligoribonuclease NrnB/cAMP/cGMP phosphodiesterase (DHH superfamily)